MAVTVQSAFSTNAILLKPVVRTGGTSSNFASANSSSGSISFTLPGSGTNWLLIGISINSSGTSVSSVTWKPDSGNAGADQALTFLGRNAALSASTEIWYLANPTATVTGSVVSHVLSANAKRIMGVQTFSGASAISPKTQTSVNSNTISIAVPSMLRALVQDTLYGSNNTTTYTAQGTQNSRWNTNTTGGTGNLRGTGSDNAGANGNVTMQWNIGATTNLNIIGTSINPNLIGGFSMDSVVMPRFTANAVLQATISGSFTADAWFVGIQSFTANALLLAERSGSFTADAITKVLNQPGSFVADAISLKTQSGSFSADAILKRTINGDAGYPVLQSSDDGTDTTTVGSHDITLPSGIEVGDLLIVALSFSNVSTITWPADWSHSLVAQAAPFSVALLHVRYKIADGTETSPITVTSSNNATAAWRSFRFSPADYVHFPPLAASTNGDNTNPNPPNLATGWGDYRIFWLAIEAADQAKTVTAYPTNYDDNQLSQNSTDVTLGTATRNYLVATENPGTFTITASEQWASATVAVHPQAPILADAVIIFGFTGSFTGNAVLLKTISGSFTADALISVTRSGSFTANAVVLKTISGSLAADADLFKTISGSATANAILTTTQAGAFSANAVLIVTNASSLTADSIVFKTTAGSFTADAFIPGGTEFEFIADAIVLASTTGSFTADAVIRQITSASFTADADLHRNQSFSLTANAVILKGFTGSYTADASIAGVASGSFTGNAVLKKNLAFSLTENAVLKKTITGTFTANAQKVRTITATKTFDAYIRPPYRQQHPRTGPQHTGTDRDIDHTIAWLFDRYLRGDSLADVLVDIDVRLTARERRIRNYLQRFRANAITKAASAHTFLANAYFNVTLGGTFTADSLFQPAFRANSWVFDSAYYLTNDVLTAPTWTIDSNPRAAFINTTSLTHDATNDPTWWGTDYLSAWMKFTLSSTTTVIIDDVQTGGDSVIELWTGGPGSWPGSPTEWDDDSVDNELSDYPYAEHIEISLPAGTYWVLVHPFDDVPSPDFNLLLRIRTA